MTIGFCTNKMKEHNEVNMKISMSNGSAKRLQSCIARMCASLCAAVCLAMLLAATGCDEAAGNYSSKIDRLVWASDHPDQSGTAFETFNIFIMDSKGGNRSQLTHDSWPVINQHPVFTPDSQSVVWAHGSVGSSSLWIMKRDGSGKQQITTPPADQEDGHPWVGADGRIYFVRHRHSSQTHKIWRMNLDGSQQVELIGSEDRDRYHPNLRSDKKLVLYTAGPPGSGNGTEIRVFNQETKQDSVFYSPGWPVSAAIWHPDGNRAVVAEDRNRNGIYQLAEISYPGGAVLRSLTNNRQDNTIPYYAYPSGAAIDWVQWPGGRRNRHIAWMKSDGTGQILLTNDGYENTKILGELEIASDDAGGRRREHCKPRPVGCYPTPPPCEKVLLPNAIAEDAEKLGWTSGQAQKDTAQQVASDSYRSLMERDLKAYIEQNPSYATEELRKRAIALREFLSGNEDGDVQERVADIYVNSYLAAGRHE